MDERTPQHESGFDCLRELGRRWHRPGGFALLLGLLVVGVNYKVVFGGETFVLRDFSIFGYPLAAHVRESIWAGEFPLWNPLNDCGHPFLAQWNTMALYPLALFYIVLPLSWALGVFCLLHQFAGGLGMYFLARSWTRNSHGACLAGVIYAFNGIMQNSLMWPNNIAGLGWLPWVILVVQLAWRKGGRMLVVAALLGGLQMLSGAPEVILFTWAIGAMVLIVEMSRDAGQSSLLLRRFMVVVAVTALLAAVQLIPFFDLLRHTQRVATGETLEWFIPWYGWANYFLPYFDNIGPQASGVVFQKSQTWTHSYYLGMAPLLVLLPAVIGNRSRLVWALAGGAILGLLLAMGPEAWIYTWLDSFLPLEVMRFPVKFLMVCAVLIPLLAAYGVRRLAFAKTKVLSVISVIAVTILFALAVRLFDRLELPPAGRDIARASVKWQLACLMATAFVLLSLSCFRGVRRSLMLLGLVLLVAGDLKWHQPNLSPSVPKKLYDMPNPQIDRLQGAVYPLGRVLPSQAMQEFNLRRESVELTQKLRDNRAGLFSNANLLDGMAQVNGFYSLWLPHFADMYWQLFDGPLRYQDKLADFVGITCANTLKGPELWLERPTALPLVTVGRRPVFRELETTAEYFNTQEFDPSEMVYLPIGTEAVFPEGRVIDARVSELDIKPHQIRFRITSSAATVATIAQTHFHWWQAEVDGQRVPIHLANRAFQAVPVPEGEHVVILRYVDWGFRIGALISLSTLAGCIFFLRRRIVPAQRT